MESGEEVRIWSEMSGQSIFDLFEAACGSFADRPALLLESDLPVVEETRYPGQTEVLPDLVDRHTPVCAALADRRRRCHG